MLQRNARGVGGPLLPALLSSLALVAASACSQADSAPPVATVSFTSSKTRLPVSSPVEFTYKFDVAPDAKIPGDFRVFMHVDNADGATIWTDDHDPPVPTSKWTPGQTVQYTRRRFVPRFAYVGEATVEVGLYRDTERLALSGPDPADRESASRSYTVGTLQLLPESENIFLIFKNGWHAQEFSPEDATIEWQWTQKTATLTFRNPRRDVNFYIEYDARPDLFSDRPQQVSVYSGEHVVGSFAADSSAPTLKIMPISRDQLGTNEMAEIRIDVDRPFVPAKMPAGGKDDRELGIRVYHVYVEGR
jgi:hypothetical protein